MSAWCRASRYLVVLAVTSLVACGESPTLQPETASVAIVGAQLIDGTGAAPVADSVVVIRDGRIHAAGPRATTAIPAGAEILDGAGKTVIPGLVDTHNHYPGDLAAVERQLRT